MGSFTMAKRPRASTNDQITEIMATEYYKSGYEFSVSDMFDRCAKVTCQVRMNHIFTEMLSIGLLDRVRIRGLVRYKKPMVSILRDRWVSEEAENLCAGDNGRILVGQAARDVSRRAKRLQAVG